MFCSMLRQGYIFCQLPPPPWARGKIKKNSKIGEKMKMKGGREEIKRGGGRKEKRGKKGRKEE